MVVAIDTVLLLLGLIIIIRHTVIGFVRSFFSFFKLGVCIVSSFVFTPVFFPYLSGKVPSTLGYLLVFIGTLLQRIELRDVQSGDYIIMFSDGICLTDSENPWLIDALSRQPKKSLKEYADYILSVARKNCPADDDMTVVVTRIGTQG